jgi:hypothetical protein
MIICQIQDGYKNAVAATRFNSYEAVLRLYKMYQKKI